MLTAKYKAGETIFRSGDRSEFAYILRTGRVRVIAQRGDEEVELGVVGPGEVLGEMGLVEERPRSATAIAVEDTEMTAATQDQFLQQLFNHPEEGLRYIQALFERLRSMNSRVIELGEPQIERPDPTATERLAAALVPATPEAREALGQDALRLDRPCLMGRTHAHGTSENTVSLADRSPYQISRAHLAIEPVAEGWVVRDRGSYLGSVVNGQSLGGDRSKAAVTLGSGEHTIVLGRAQSKYRFTLKIP